MTTSTEQSGWSRRRFLRGMGVAIGLPFLPSLFPRAAWAGEPGAAEHVAAPMRLMFCCVPLGFVPNQSLFVCQGFADAGSTGWFPEQDGPLTAMPAVHAALEPYRAHVAFLKGLSHRKYRGDAHRGDDVFLTGADTFSDPAKALSNTVSCDLVAAASPALGGENVRYASLSWGNRGGNGSATGGLSWSDGGVPITPMWSPVAAFDQLFGTEEVPATVRLLRLKQRRSILDCSIGQIKRLDRDLNAADRAKLDEVVTAVRGAEAGIQREERWLDIAKPTVAIKRPEESSTTCSNVHVRIMFQLAHAAFLTDSTRVIAFEMPGSFLEVSRFDKHQLNHDLNPERARDAVKVDAAMSAELAGFAKLLAGSAEHGGGTLLDRTCVAYGSGAWGANHCMKSLPVLLLGGGAKLKLGVTRSYGNVVPLANAWLSLLQACGVDATRFADSTGPLDGLA